MLTVPENEAELLHILPREGMRPQHVANLATAARCESRDVRI